MPAQVSMAWVRRYDNGQTNGERPSAIAVDAAGNVHVTGHSQNAAGGNDCVTIKYNTDGVELWRHRDADMAGAALAVDAAGNLYLAGSIRSGTDSDFLTIKYDGAGNRIWTARQAAPGSQDWVAEIAVDPAGAVYVTGTSIVGGNREYVTIKYDASGNVVWVARYANASSPVAIAVDGSGNVFVTGAAATVKYDANGAELWASRFNNEGGTALALDASGNAYVAGYTSGASGGTDYLTIKHDPAGTALWRRQWNVGNSDRAEAIGVAGSYVYVTGGAGNYSGALLRSFATLQYSIDGTLRWARATYPWYGSAYALATDPAANVYVTGVVNSQNYRDDFATVKYSPAGDMRWTIRYHFVQSDGPAIGIRLDAAGNVYVTGQSEGPDMADGTDQDDYATIKYVQSRFSLGMFCWPWREDPFGRRWRDFLRCLVLPILLIVSMMTFTGMIIRQRRSSGRTRDAHRSSDP